MKKNMLKSNNNIVKKFYVAVVLCLLVGVTFSGVMSTGRIKEPSGTSAGYWSGGVQYIMNSNGKTWTATGDNLQEAIWDLNSSNGGIVYLPDGEITINNLSIIDNLYIKGNGMKTTKLKSGNSFPIINITTPSNYLIISDVYFDGDSKSTHVFKSCAGSVGNRRTWVINCNISYGTEASVYLEDSNCDGLHFENCYIANSPYGVYLNSTSPTNYFTNCHIKGTTHPIRLVGSSGHFTDCFIIAHGNTCNELVNGSYESFSASFSTEFPLTFNNCHFEGNTTGDSLISIGDGSVGHRFSNVKITGCTLRPTGNTRPDYYIEANYIAGSGVIGGSFVCKNNNFYGPPYPNNQYIYLGIVEHVEVGSNFYRDNSYNASNEPDAASSSFFESAFIQNVSTGSYAFYHELDIRAGTTHAALNWYYDNVKYWEFYTDGSGDLKLSDEDDGGTPFKVVEDTGTSAAIIDNGNFSFTHDIYAGGDIKADGGDFITNNCTIRWNGANNTIKVVETGTGETYYFDHL